MRESDLKPEWNFTCFVLFLFEINVDFQFSIDCKNHDNMTLTMTTLEGAIPDFYNLLTAPRTELSPTRTLKRLRRNRVQVTCNTWCAIRYTPSVCYPTQSQYTYIRQTSPRTAVILPDVWQKQPLQCQGFSHWYTSNGKQSPVSFACFLVT